VRCEVFLRVRPQSEEVRLLLWQPTEGTCERLDELQDSRDDLVDDYYDDDDCD
jgi:hypothetical protein